MGFPVQVRSEVPPQILAQDRLHSLLDWLLIMQVEDPSQVLSFNMAQLMAAFQAAGYKLTDQDRRSFLHHAVMNTRQGHNPSFQFLVMCCDDDEPAQYYLTYLTVRVEDNVAKAEPDNMPFFAGTEHKCKEVFDSMIRGK